MNEYKKLDCCKYCLNLNDEECPCLGDVSADEDYYSCDFHSPNYWKIWDEARAEAIDECINVMKYSWYNGQQPLDVLVRRLELLKEKKND